MVLINN